MVSFADRAVLSAIQISKLNRGLARLRRRNGFYRRKLEGIRLPLTHLEDLAQLPFTRKSEWLDDQAEYPPFGTNLTSPPWRYTRFHQTSGTTGRPLYWLDTGRTWAWFLHCWREVYRGAGVGPEDIVFAAFGFGPFLGFWGGFEAAQTLGAMVVAGGAQDSLGRVRSILDSQATVLLATPTYALRLSQVARENGIDLASSGIDITIHAGEPGANIPATRARIEEAWGARAFDHAGMTEAGAWGFECHERAGLHLIESDFIGEVLHPGTDRPVAEGDEGELVLTNLGRWDMPAVRYRTGDVVRPRFERCPCGRADLRFEGGVQGRVDDMIQVRGVNVYPSAVENLIRAHAEIVEFQVEVVEMREMNEISVHVEVAPIERASEVCAALQQELAYRLSLRTTVLAAPAGSLPRFELKAKRFTVKA